MGASARTTVYLQPELRDALRLKAAQTKRPFSDLVNAAIRLSLSEDFEDDVFDDEPRNDALVKYENFLEELRMSGRI